MFLAHFDAKQRRDGFQQPHSRDPSPVLCSVAFQDSFVRSLFLDLDPYGENDSDRMNPLFNKQMTWELAFKLAIIFRHLAVVLACWRLADVQSIPISITPLLSNVFEKIVAGKFSIFCKVTVCFLLLSFHIGRTWEHVMLCSHCLTIYKLLGTGA